MTRLPRPSSRLAAAGGVLLSLAMALPAAAAGVQLDWNADPMAGLRKALAEVRREERHENLDKLAGPVSRGPVQVAMTTRRDYTPYTYTAYQPDPRPNGTVDYKPYADGDQQRRCEQWPDAPGCEGTEAYCRKSPWLDACKGTAAACSYDPSKCAGYCNSYPSASACAGTLARCTQYPSAGDCAGTSVRCSNYPSASDCAGTVERCTQYPSASDCAGTRARCEAYPSASDCVGTPAYCAAYNCD